MTARSVLVTAATGKTGAYTVSLLLKHGHHVRALVHREDERAANLRQQGAEVVIGDLLDLAVVAEATQGIETAYFCYPIDPGLVEASAYFAQAARDAGVHAIVNMSQISARREAKSDAARQHWISERVFDWAGVPVTHIRPTFFAEWLLLFAEAIGKNGILPLPFGDGRHAPIAAEDQAHVIAAILETPKLHAGKVYPLYGPVEMNHYEIAAEVAAVLKRPVLYAPVEVEAFAEMMVKERHLPPHLIQHVSAVAIDYREGVFAGTNDVVERVGRIQPTTVRAFVEKHRLAFQF